MKYWIIEIQKSPKSLEPIATRVGTKTIFWPFAKTKTLAKGVLIFAKFRQLFAKGFRENFSRKVFAKVKIRRKVVKKLYQTSRLASKHDVLQSVTIMTAFSDPAWHGFYFTGEEAEVRLILLEPKLCSSSKYSQFSSSKFADTPAPSPH
jgi:hypothetical protein